MCPTAPAAQWQQWKDHACPLALCDCWGIPLHPSSVAFCLLVPLSHCNAKNLVMTASKKCRDSQPTEFPTFFFKNRKFLGSCNTHCREDNLSLRTCSKTCCDAAGMERWLVQHSALSQSCTNGVGKVVPPTQPHAHSSHPSMLAQGWHR